MRYLLLPVVGGIGSLMVGYYALKTGSITESLAGAGIFLIASFFNHKDTRSLKASLVSSLTIVLGGIVAGITIANPTSQRLFLNSNLIAGAVFMFFGLVWNYFFALEGETSNSDG